MNFTKEDKEKEILNLILKSYSNAISNEHQSTLISLNELEKNQIAFGETLLDILVDYKVKIEPMGYFEQTEIMIYIKNVFQKIKENSNVKKIPNLCEKVVGVLNYYFNFEFGQGKLMLFFDEIIEFLFDFVNYTNDCKKFLEYVFVNVLRQKANSQSAEMIRKITVVLEIIFCVYINYITQQSELNDFFCFFNLLLSQSESIAFAKKDIDNESNEFYNLLEKHSKLFSQIMYSFAKIALKANDYFMKSEIYSFTFYSDADKIANLSFIENDAFLSFIRNSLMLVYNNTTKSEVNNIFLIVLPQIENDYTFTNIFNINVSKSKAFLIELITIITQKLTKHNIIEKFPKWSALVTSVTTLTVDHLVSLYKSGNYSKHDPNSTNPCDNANLVFIVKLFIYLETICDSLFAHSLLYPKRFDILQYIILPNLTITPYEDVLFSMDSNEFVKNMIDICHACEERVPKQKALKLFNSMNDNFDGFFAFTTELSIKCINKLTGLKHNCVYVNDDNPVYLTMSTMNNRDLMEVALLMMTSSSFLLSEREKVNEYFEDSIDTANYLLVKINDNMLKAYLCMFYSYTLDDLFHSDIEVLSKSFDDSLNFLFSCVVENDSCEPLYQLALNCINSVIFQKELISFCGTMVRIFANKVILHVQMKKMKTFENDFTTFVKGIIKFYMVNVDLDVIELHDFFWKSFDASLTKILSEKKEKRKALAPKQDLSDISSNTAIIRTFLLSITNKSIEIKNHVYGKVLDLIFHLSKFLNTDFEGDLIDLVIIVINDVKMLPENYIKPFKEYINTLNSGTDGVFDYKFEAYHVEYLFTLLSSFKPEISEANKLKELFFNLISVRINVIPRKKNVSQIIAEHCIYIDFVIVFTIYYYAELDKEIISQMLSLLFTRMEKKPNTDLDLNVKLSIAIFILILKVDNFDVLSQLDMCSFMNKVTNFFPVKSLSAFQHELIAFALGYIVRYVIVKGGEIPGMKPKQIEQLLINIIKIEFDELILIKQKSMDKFKNEKNLNKDKKEEKCEFEINNHTFTFSNRKSHIDSKKQTMKLSKSFSEDEISFSSDESENAIDEEGKENRYYDDNTSESEIDNESENASDKDDEFVHLKNKTNESFDKYYAKFANQSFTDFINNVNQFQFFDFMLKDIQLQNSKFYNKLINSFSENKQKLIEKFRNYQKISFNNNSTNTVDYLYRKIVKIKK